MSPFIPDCAAWTRASLSGLCNHQDVARSFAMRPLEGPFRMLLSIVAPEEDSEKVPTAAGAESELDSGEA